MHCQSLNRPLSAEFLFYHAGQRMPSQDASAGLTFEAVEDALQMEGQPDEQEWPYQLTQPNPWMPPVVTKRWYGSMTTNASGVVAHVMSSLQAGYPVVLGLRVTVEFVNLEKAPFVVPAVGQGFGGHAVLAVGAGQHLTLGQLILIRNSWGPKWGIGGHGWLPAAYFSDKLIGHRIVAPRDRP
jgi:Papain family cysteine protease